MPIFLNQLIDQLSHLSRKAQNLWIQVRVQKSHMDPIGTVMLSIRMCYQLYTEVKFRVKGKYLFQGYVSNKHHD